MNYEKLPKTISAEELLSRYRGRFAPPADPENRGTLRYGVHAKRYPL